MIGEHTKPSLHVTEPPAQSSRKLSGQIVPRAALQCAVREEMFELFDTYYSNASVERFFADLDAKAQVMLLRSPTGALVGFSTLDEQITECCGERVRIFFSGDTIIAPAFWGTPEMPRLWTRYMFFRAAEDPQLRAFWFLISSGYKTYRLLPLFFRSFYPQRLNHAPPLLPELLAELANTRFGAQYLPAEGIVRLSMPTPLRPGVAEVAESRSNNPDIRYFLERNPRHDAGDELACLAELRRDNLTAAGQKMLGLLRRIDGARS